MTTTNEPMGLHPRVDGCRCHACLPDRAYDSQDRATIDGVLHHGWQVMVVGAGTCECPDCDGEAEDDAPAFAYTIGLGHRAGHPELVMSGLDPDLMHRALNSLAQRVLEGRRLVAGDLVEGVLGRVPVVMAAMTARGLTETVTWSGWFHRRPPEALLVVWPSTSAVFAWQPGAPAVLDELQPPGWRDPVPEVGSLARDPAWTFPVPPDGTAISCTHVLEHGRPVLVVAREVEDGNDTWQFLCGDADHGAQDGLLVHMAHVVRGAPSVRSVADLPAGWAAERSDVDAPWSRGPVD